MISPVPVTLKRFLALEFVFTFGISIICYDYSLLASPHWRSPCRALWELGGEGIVLSRKKQDLSFFMVSS